MCVSSFRIFVFCVCVCFCWVFFWGGGGLFFCCLLVLGWGGAEGSSCDHFGVHEGGQGWVGLIMINIKIYCFILESRLFHGDTLAAAKNRLFPVLQLALYACHLWQKAHRRVVCGEWCCTNAHTYTHTHTHTHTKSKRPKHTRKKTYALFSSFWYKHGNQLSLHRLTMHLYIQIHQR